MEKTSRLLAVGMLLVAGWAGGAEPNAGAVRFGGTRLEKAQCDAAKGAAAAAACKAGGDVEKVTAACAAAVAKDPSQASGHKLLANLLAKQKKVADAAREYETYLLSCPDAADAGMVRKILDELAAARGH